MIGLRISDGRSTQLILVQLVVIREDIEEDTHLK